MKDHQLALLDSNQYPDHGVALASVKPLQQQQQQQLGDCCATYNDQLTAAAAARSDKTSKHADLLQVNKRPAGIVVTALARWRL